MGFSKGLKIVQKKLLAKETKWTDKVGLPILSVLISRFSFGPVKSVRLARNSLIKRSGGQAVGKMLNSYNAYPTHPTLGHKILLANCVGNVTK